MSDNIRQIAQDFEKFNRAFLGMPQIIADTSVQTFRGSLQQKQWDGTPYMPYQGKNEPTKGSLMTRDYALFNSIKESIVTPNLVRISAGGAKVPYARIHNEGGTIFQGARTELFNRNRYKSGKKKGSFKRGTTAGRGFVLHKRTIEIPQRQFIGPNNENHRRIRLRLAKYYNNFK